jgi:hypothetical protein
MVLMKFSYLFVLVLSPVLVSAQTDSQADTPIEKHRQTDRPARYISRPMRQTARVNAVYAGVTQPVWQATQGSYTYQMIGADPTVAGAGTTTVTANVIPLVLTFSNGTTFDPTVANTCTGTQSAESLVLSSPIFNNSAYSVNGVSVGTTQYLDYFQRSNFWQYTQPTGISPDYHTLLSAAPLAAIKIAVPSGNGTTVSAPCGKLGEMEIGWFDSYLQSTVFPQLASLGITPANLPVFVMSNVVMYQTSTADCCILGYHSGFNNPSFGGAAHYYAVADFETSGAFSSVKDISPMTHETGEWLDDPTGNNPTPAWGHIGQVTGCQTNLEAGDPLTPTGITLTGSNGYAYHLQELAFKSWFYRDAASIGINGWYSSNGTFKTYAAPCASSLTTLTVSPVSIAPGSATTIAIKVAPGSGYTGTPSGSVSLVASSNATALATYPLVSGTVNTTAILPAGSYSVIAAYAGDSNFSSSSSAPVAVQAGSPSVALSPISLTFASQTVATVSVSQAINLTNNGTAPLSVSSVTLSGANPADFSRTSGCGTSVSVGGNCSITVTFKPTAAGSRTAFVNIADSATGSPQSVPVSGTGVAAAPAVTLTPTSLNFASTTVGTATASQSVVLKNTGTGTLTISAVAMSGANPGDFSQTNNCGPSVGAGGSCTFSVKFKPTAKSTRTATLSITNNAPLSPHAVALTGTGK